MIQLRTYKVSGSKVYFKFSYNPDIVFDIKQIPGRVYIPITKEWVVENDIVNFKQIREFVNKHDFKSIGDEFLNDISQNDVNVPTTDYVSNFDLNKFNFQPRPYQIEAINYMLTKKCVINGDDVGCISGDAIIQLNRGGRGFSLKLSELYMRFNLLNKRKWDSNAPTYCKCLDEKSMIFTKGEIDRVLYRGVKKTLNVKFDSGKELRLTEDHEVLSKNFGWVEICRLKIGDIVYGNGISICKQCGSTENIISYKQAKFRGYCRECMYRILRKNTIKDGRYLDGDGYLMVSGVYNHPRARKGTPSSVPEHILVMERKLGRHLDKEEVVHHIDENKINNDISNLQLMTASDHAKHHSKKNYRNLDSDRIVLIPKEEIIKSIEVFKEEDVYDIVMKGYNRNFVANKIVVHNCGKTYEAIFSAEIGDLLPCLVITLDSVKQHWKRSWLSVIERKIQVINAGDTFEQGMDIYIINYQSLAKRGEIKGNSKDFEVEIKYKELQQIEFKSIVVDESHNTKNSKSIRSKAIKKLAKKIPYVFLLTGTAIMNRPSELINPLQIIRVFDKVFGGWNSYIQKFCDAKRTPFGLDISGNSNTKELNQILRQNCYIRREKSEVLKDLPDLQQTLLPVSISNKSTYNKAEKSLISYLKENKGEMAADKAELAEFLVLRNELRQLVGIGKVRAVKEFVDSLLEETTDKIIIFGIHKEPLKQLAEYYKCWTIDGSVKSEDKQLIIDDFKESKERILLGNMNALGTGTDGLQHVSSTMIIFELPDRPADLTQVSGRLHRSGQKNNVQILIPIASDTFDDVLWENIEHKMVVTEAVNSGRDVKQKSLNSIILRKFLNKK